ncbi:MAG: cyclic lactone autoinducer peptide [Bacillota bacterium]
MKKWVLMTLTTVLMFIASISSVFACSWILYQPEVPESLQK